MRQPLSEYDERDEHDERIGLIGEERPEAYVRGDRRLPSIALSVLAMAVFAGGLWFAYVEGTRHAAPTGPSSGGVPLIRADQQPTKVKPEQPGGMQIPDQNVSIYNEKPGVPAVEKLLPPPEKPLPRPAAPPPPAAPAVASPSPPGAAAATDAPPVPQRAAMPPPAAAPPAAHATVAAAPPHAAVAGEGPLRVQVGAVRTPDEARSQWARLKRDYPDLLGRLTARAVRADLREKGVFYRIQAGAFADAGAAERLCSELKRRKLGCTLVR
jgi:cell division protein FtsN